MGPVLGVNAIRISIKNTTFSTQNIELMEQKNRTNKIAHALNGNTARFARLIINKQ
jgi:hypothetical protein